MIGVQDRARRGKVIGVVGALVPRHVEHGVQPGADPTDLRGLLGGSFQLVDLGQCSLGHLLRQVRGLYSGSVVLLLARGLAAELGQFLADRAQLLAQQELALLLVHTLLDVLADRLGDVELSEVLAAPRDKLLQPGRHVDGLQQPQLLLVRQVRRVAGQIGEHRWVGDGLDGVDHLPRAPLLQDRRGKRLVLARELCDLVAVRGFVLCLGLHPQRGAWSSSRATDLGPSRAAHHCGMFAAAHPAHLLDNADRADAGVLAVEPGDQQHLRWLPVAVFTGLGSFNGSADLAVTQLHRDNHARQDDDVVEGEHGQS